MKVDSINKELKRLGLTKWSVELDKNNNLIQKIILTHDTSNNFYGKSVCIIYKNNTNCSGLYFHNMFFSGSYNSTKESKIDFLKEFDSVVHAFTVDQYYSFQFSVSPDQWNQLWRYLPEVNPNWVVVETLRRGAPGFNRYLTLGVKERWKK